MPPEDELAARRRGMTIAIFAGAARVVQPPLDLEPSLPPNPKALREILVARRRKRIRLVE